MADGAVRLNRGLEKHAAVTAVLPDRSGLVCRVSFPANCIVRPSWLMSVTVGVPCQLITRMPESRSNLVIVQITTA